MPMRQSTYNDFPSHSSSGVNEPKQSERLTDAKPQLSQLAVHRLTEEHDRPHDEPAPEAGWWDVVSAVHNETPAPWHDNSETTNKQRARSSAASQVLTLPPGAAQARSPQSKATYTEVSTDHSEYYPSTPPRRQISSSSPGRDATVYERSPGNDSSGRSATGRTSSSPGKVKTENGYFDRGARENPVPMPLHPSLTKVPSASLNNSQYTLIASPPPVSPPAITLASISATKAKLGGFGRSMSSAISRSKKEEKDEDKENEKDKMKSGKKVMNNPEKWNRDFVANIMGPPAEKK